MSKEKKGLGLLGSISEFREKFNVADKRMSRIEKDIAQIKKDIVEIKKLLEKRG
jgi:peptidoglycan hydrolase CwlO-like protein